MELRRWSARRAVRRGADAPLGRFDDLDPTELLLLVFGSVGVGVLVASVLFLTAPSDDRPTADARMNIPLVEEARPTYVEYTNRQGGYTFEYPTGWDARDEGMLTRVESPNGRILVSFDIGVSGRLEAVAARLVRSLGGPAVDVIGTRQERIAGSPSLLTGGIGEDETGERIRFLAIAVSGQPLNYEISILVPVRSDPRRLLPRLEEIVSSFEILEPSLF